MNDDICGLVLAAGASKRYSTEPKLLCQRGSSGKTLIQHCLDEVSKSPAITSTLVVLGAHASKIEARTTFPKQISALSNPHHERGIGSSIAFGVQHLIQQQRQRMSALDRKFSILLILADQPEVTSSYIDALVCTHNGNADRLTVSRYNEASFGPPIIFGSHYLNELTQLSGDVGAKNILRSHARMIQFLDDKHFRGFDIDTLEDEVRWNKESESMVTLPEPRVDKALE